MESPFITTKDKIIDQINRRYDEEIEEENARYYVALKKSEQQPEVETELHAQNLNKIESLRNEALSKIE